MANKSKQRQRNANHILHNEKAQYVTVISIKAQ